MSNRTNLKNMFERSVVGTVNLISRQVSQVENIRVGGEGPYQVAVNP